MVGFLYHRRPNIFKEIIPWAGIPHTGSWRGIRVGLRGRFVRDTRLGRGESLKNGIFGVISLRRFCEKELKKAEFSLCSLRRAEELGESL